MDKTKKKNIKRAVFLVFLAAVVVLLAVLPLLASTEEDDGPTASILSGTVTAGEIGNAIRGGGTLTAQDAVEVSIPSGVKLTEFLVSNGEYVNEGDAVAVADRVTVMSAIAQVQETLDYLDEQIEEARDAALSDTVTAQGGGRVKLVYAQAGDSVQDVMLEHGALAVLSLDGLMAVDISRKTDLAPGDSVLVTVEDTEVTGWVETNLDGVLTITVADEGYAVGTSVLVTTEDGHRIGAGTLYIHNAWNATAVSGTVSRVNVTEETSVSAGRTLFTLTDTEYTAEFELLCAQRQEYADVMLELFRLYQDLTVTASCDGAVSGVDESSACLLAEQGSGYVLSLLVNAPNGDDSREYHNYLATVAAVGTNGWAVAMDPNNLAVTDYKTLADMPLDTSGCTELMLYSGDAFVYELVEGEWQQIDAASVTAGDTVLFAVDVDGNCIWVVRIAREPQTGEEETVPDETVPSETPGEAVTPEEDPTQPSEEETGETETGSTDIPGGSSGSQGSSGGMTGGYSGSFGGGTTAEETVEMYSLDRSVILSVIAQETMTLSITVDEMDIGSLSLGMAAEVALDALRNETFSAWVSEIGTDGESSGGSSKFTVTLTLDRTESMLSGMNATVSIPLEGAEQGLVIPVEALTEVGSTTYVYTGYDEASGQLTAPVAVETGASDGVNVRILSGLGEGDTFWYAYYDTLDIESASAGTSTSGGFNIGNIFGRNR